MSTTSRRMEITVLFEKFNIGVHVDLQGCRSGGFV
jgi:hypothetical protein